MRQTFQPSERGSFSSTRRVTGVQQTALRHAREDAVRRGFAAAGGAARMPAAGAIVGDVFVRLASPISLTVSTVDGFVLSLVRFACNTDQCKAAALQDVVLHQAEECLYWAARCSPEVAQQQLQALFTQYAIHSEKYEFERRAKVEAIIMPLYHACVAALRAACDPGVEPMPDRNLTSVSKDLHDALGRFPLVQRALQVKER